MDELGSFCPMLELFLFQFPVGVISVKRIIPNTNKDHNMVFQYTKNWSSLSLYFFLNQAPMQANISGNDIVPWFQIYRNWKMKEVYVVFIFVPGSKLQFPVDRIKGQWDKHP